MNLTAVAPARLVSGQRGLSCQFSRPALGRHVNRSRPTSLMVASAIVVSKKASSKVKAADIEQGILDILQDARGRGKNGLTETQQEALAASVEQLEAIGGLKDPTTTDEINGTWKLLYTSRPGTSSPIQRTFTGVEAFTVLQEVFLQDDEARINNCVDFGEKVGILRVEALANTDIRPIPGFTPRRGAGLPIFGKSSTYPPAQENMRIDFQFDNAAFNFYNLPFRIPYPVPFRLIGDEGKGWIDVTYMSVNGRFRISRGNKGTTFILVKDKTEKEQLLDFAAAGDDNAVKEMIEEIENPTKSPATSALTEGTWRLLWSEQADNANFLQKNLAGKVKTFQTLYTDDNGKSRVQNLVDLGFLKIKADAFCEPSSSNRTSVDIREVVFEIAGLLQIPVKVNKSRKHDDPVGYLDWLYLDNDIRITRGSKGSLFIHTRED